ncbi:hypothetical protein Emag_002582 [Eimeria magna]
MMGAPQGPPSTLAAGGMSLSLSESEREEMMQETDSLSLPVSSHALDAPIVCVAEAPLPSAEDEGGPLVFRTVYMPIQKKESRDSLPQREQETIHEAQSDPVSLIDAYEDNLILASSSTLTVLLQPLPHQQQQQEHQHQQQQEQQQQQQQQHHQQQEEEEEGEYDLLNTSLLSNRLGRGHLSPSGGPAPLSLPFGIKSLSCGDCRCLAISEERDKGGKAAAAAAAAGRQIVLSWGVEPTYTSPPDIRFPKTREERKKEERDKGGGISLMPNQQKEGNQPDSKPSNLADARGPLLPDDGSSSSSNSSSSNNSSSISSEDEGLSVISRRGHARKSDGLAAAANRIFSSMQERQLRTHVATAKEKGREGPPSSLLPAQGKGGPPLLYPPHDGGAPHLLLFF